MYGINLVRNLCYASVRVPRRQGRKGSYRTKAREAGEWSCTCALAFFIAHPRREPRRTKRCRSFTRHPPDSMLRPSSRLIDSSASAVPLSAASGRCGRRVRAADAAQAPGRLCVRFHPLFVMSFCTEPPISPPRLPVWPTATCRDRGPVLFHSGQIGRFRSCSYPFSNLSFRTVSPFSLLYTTPEAAGGRHGRRTVLFCFREAVSRFGPSDCIPGNGAALDGIREGGRTGNPVPRYSPFSDILFSVRKNDDIQFKDRPSDRRHAYF